MKEGIVSTFDSNVALYEEDVKKADSQRQLAGWQYTTFFAQKVCGIGCLNSPIMLTLVMLNRKDWLIASSL